MKTILEKVKEAIPTDGRFTAVDIAEIIGLPINIWFQNSSPIATKYLLQLCKTGMIVQWVVSNGGKHDTIDNCPSWSMYYVRKNSPTFDWIMSGSNRRLDGYKIR